MVDIPGEFLITDMDEDFIIVLLVILMEMMVKTEPIVYQNFVAIENVRAVLYVELHKSLYGFMRSAILFYEKLVSELNTIGFISNT